MTGETGSKLDVYDLEVAAEREDVLRDLAEFQLAAVGGGCWRPRPGRWAGAGAGAGPLQWAQRGAETRWDLQNAMLESGLQHHHIRGTSAPSPTPRPLPCAPLLGPQTLYNAMLENNCSEHASRMSAMENSTKSAGEMLESLTLKCAGMEGG
jgi:hypothetical protein